MSRLASIQEVADKYSVSHETIRQALKNGKIPDEAIHEIWTGRSRKPLIRLDLDILEEFWKEKRTPAAGARWLLHVVVMRLHSSPPSPVCAGLYTQPVAGPGRAG